MTDNTEPKYIEETYRGAPLLCEASVVEALGDMGIDAMQELRNKVDEVYDTERTFSEALYELKAGTKMRRKSWPTDRFIYLVNGSTFSVTRPPLNKLFTDGRSINYQSHIDEFNGEDNARVWHATNEDLLADDWHVHG